jgi:TetR/AcrR family transcriptional regulator, transcriptional repressor for nem operon
LINVVKAGITAKEIEKNVDPKKLAILIISSPEGALMISRVERDREALQAVKSYLDGYVESEGRRRSK